MGTPKSGWPCMSMVLGQIIDCIPQIFHLVSEEVVLGWHKKFNYASKCTLTRIQSHSCKMGQRCLCLLVRAFRCHTDV